MQKVTPEKDAALSGGVSVGLVFKIVKREAWELACLDGAYRGSRDDERDGFIHLSAPHQVAGTLAKHFIFADNLLLIAFDRATLSDDLKWEKSRGGELFPHYYGTLNTRHALWSRPLVLGPENVPEFDEAWLK